MSTTIKPGRYYVERESDWCSVLYTETTDGAQVSARTPSGGTESARATNKGVRAVVGAAASVTTPASIAPAGTLCGLTAYGVAREAQQ